ncbi:Kinetochore protein Spc24 [Chelonia mydas]|uniref:Kinetochore protein Spc24 n=1 Tax=Chelonia mydas TaxID=8469 RepID=M7BUM0_CHEMY|nr:Kinetochore protein Spc24 [Chelonia mydas]
MMNEQMQEMEEVSKELLKLLAAGGAGNLLKRSLDKQEKMFDKLLDTQLTAAQLVKDLLATEEKVAQKLLAGEEEMQTSLQKVLAMEEALQRAIHHGPAIAQPINIDSSQHSKCFVSDYLWSLVDTAW